jgi:hypothetical protein
MACAAFWAFVSATEPVNPTLAPGSQSVTITRQPDGAMTLRLHYLSKPSPLCVRQWTEVMYLGSHFYTIASGTSGRGTGRGSVDYHVYRYVPAGLPAGDWSIVLRVRHECEPAGLVHWNYVSEPVTIRVP